MNVQCGENLEARLMYFIYNDEKWNHRIMPLSQIPFYATPPRIRKRPVLCNMTDLNTINNSLYNQVVDYLIGLCDDTGPMKGWLVIFFFQKRICILKKNFRKIYSIEKEADMPLIYIFACNVILTRDRSTIPTNSTSLNVNEA